jgi:L-asparagine transporter-like permease
MSRSDDSPRARAIGAGAGIVVVVVAAALTSRHWLPGYPDWEKALAAGLVALAVNVIVQRVIRRAKA